MGGSLAYTFLLITEITNPISIIACIWLLCSYVRMKNKSLGARMIVVLCISDFVFHTMTILTLFFLKSKLLLVTATIVGIAIRFSVFWTCNIALLLHKLLTMTELMSLKNYFKWTFLFILLLSFVLSLM